MKTFLRAIRMKRVWLVAAVAAIVASVAAIGGVAAADGGHGEKRSELNARVAEILEMDEQTVADAFDDAREQSAEEAIQAWLDKLVESSKITQEQSDEFVDWYGERPDWLTDIKFEKREFQRDRSGFLSTVTENLGVEDQALIDALAQVKGEIREEKVQQRLDAAVESGRITQEQADAIAERLESREGKEWRKALIDALAQVKGEIREEKVQQRLDAAVESGRITQEQADAIAERLESREGKEWRKALIDALAQVKGEIREEKVQQRLDAAVESGRITQEQADAIAERLESREGKEWRKHGGWGWKRAERGLH